MRLARKVGIDFGFYFFYFWVYGRFRVSLGFSGFSFRFGWCCVSGAFFSFFLCVIVMLWDI